METISILSIMTIAFLGSFGHCVGMCGGIVMAYSSTKIGNEWSKTKQTLAHISYSFGRVLTYTMLGALFGFLGGVIAFSNITNGLLLLLAGTFMVLTGLSLIGKIKFLTVIEHSVSKSSWYQTSFRSLLHSGTLFSFFLLGMLNGLLPCGFVYFFAITAASTADPFWGGVVMFIFGISTIPALFSLGFFVGLFKQSGFRNIMIKFASIAVILFGIYTLYSGYDYLTNPNKSILECHL
ncbi:MAG: sulfite exporter TauE/SafE family protein [Arcobacteraceae bacterium]|jgi:sulfite exporter TauE/SafE|nr:sulfite exporter TauE/SafE family protein [Arcobacteraceae bacterium]